MPPFYRVLDGKLMSRQASKLLGDLGDHLLDGRSAVVFKGLLRSLPDLDCEGVELGRLEHCISEDRVPWVLFDQEHGVLQQNISQPVQQLDEGTVALSSASKLPQSSSWGHICERSHGPGCPVALGTW